MKTKNLPRFALLVSLLFVISHESISQTKQLRVSVFADDNNDPIPEATIYAEGSTFVGLYRGESDQSGKATVIIKSGGEFLVSVSHPKFLSAQQIINIKQYGDQQIYSLSFRLKRKTDVPKELKPFHVYVKDKQNKPISGAAVSVSPGEVVGGTDGNGYVKAWHSQQPGEYVRVTVQAKDYKDQQKRILVGAQQGGAITRADDGAHFVLEKGENERNVRTIVVKVLDENSDQPISGANVKLNLSDGSEYAGVTNEKGEAALKDMEFGFQGTTGKVTVTHPKYKERWSDIPQELMTVMDGSERQFLVFLKKKDDDINERFVGSWRCACKITIVLNLNGTGAWVDSRGGPAGSMEESGTFSGTWSSSGDRVYLSLPVATYGRRGGTVEFSFVDGKLRDRWGGVYVR